MNKKTKAPPARMRTYRIRAEMKETPDVDKLAQLFINMALSRARAGRADDRAAQSTSRQDAHGEVES